MIVDEHLAAGPDILAANTNSVDNFKSIRGAEYDYCTSPSGCLG